MGFLNLTFFQIRKVCFSLWKASFQAWTASNANVLFIVERSSKNIKALLQPILFEQHSSFLIESTQCGFNAMLQVLLIDACRRLWWRGHQNPSSSRSQIQPPSQRLSVLVARTAIVWERQPVSCTEHQHGLAD